MRRRCVKEWETIRNGERIVSKGWRSKKGWVEVRRREYECWKDWKGATLRFPVCETPPPHPLHPNPPGSPQYAVVHQPDPGSKGDHAATMETACEAYLWCSCTSDRVACLDAVTSAWPWGKRCCGTERVALTLSLSEAERFDTHPGHGIHTAPYRHELQAATQHSHFTCRPICVLTEKLLELLLLLLLTPNQRIFFKVTLLWTVCIRIQNETSYILIFASGKKKKKRSFRGTIIPTEFWGTLDDEAISLPCFFLRSYSNARGSLLLMILSKWVECCEMKSHNISVALLNQVINLQLLSFLLGLYCSPFVARKKINK